MKNLILLFVAYLVMQVPTLAQRNISWQSQDPVFFKAISHDPNFKSFPEKSFYKQKTDWQYIIDSTWGPGLSTAHKLQVFDSFWNKIDQNWGGFPNLVINWDSLKNYYRPIVEAGVSRGRFAGILSRMTTALNEWHAGAMDGGIDSTLGLYPNSIWYDNNYPNHPFFHYRAGVPVININATYFRTPFGAGLTVLPDSSIMVYNVLNNHPLNLQPGDIILGYNDIPWKQLLNELFEAELPILSSDLCGNWLSSSNAASYHTAMMSAGMNWGLFDTIDVVKYPTNEIVHYPTSLLSTINQPYLIATEQLPVNGVPFPDLNAKKFVSWGVVEGTNIGYIYIWDWWGVPQGQTQILFGQAVDELMHINNVTGLILDFRTNPGGYPEYANEGFKHLFNVDPTSNYSQAIRVPGNDHFLFTITDPYPTEFFTPTTEIFDHPIAVLTGPRCGSSGDYNAFRLRFHPMTRFFGKETSGAYTAGFEISYYSDSYYWWRVDDGTVYSNYNNEGYMIHKTFPVDEEVWLTRDGVANSQDDVVNRALDWINNTVYPHDIISDKTYYTPDIDSVHISTIIENPNSHQLSTRGYIHNLDNVMIDSVVMTKQVLKADGEIWTGNMSTPSFEGFFKVSVTAFDETASTSFTLPNATRFTTTGPVVLDSISCTKGLLDFYYAKPFVRNEGNTFTITNAAIKLLSNDPWIGSIGPGQINLPNIPPGGAAGTASRFTVTFIDSLFPGYFNFKVVVMSNGWTYWTDSMQVIVTGVEEEELQPLSYQLEQNYPNPFNPATTIKYSIPTYSKVLIKVFDILGNEIKTLVNKEKPAGTYEVNWNAANLPSGVYFYQLKAGKYLKTMKMILLK